MKKRLDENSFAMPDNEEDKWKELYDWLIDNGFRETINPDKDNYLSHWIKRETLTPLMGGIIMCQHILNQLFRNCSVETKNSLVNQEVLFL